MSGGEIGARGEAKAEAGGEVKRMASSAWGGKPTPALNCLVVQRLLKQ
jgi:hypothetical protein